ncbi:MAG: hypothetical protein ACK5KU_06490 [Beutenbergiaceae bacterium]
MKRLLSLTAVLFLAACGTDPASDSTDSDPSAAGSESAESSQTTDPDSASQESDSATAEPPAAPIMSDASISTGPESEHGYVQALNGEPVTIFDANGTPLLELTVQGIGWEPSCTSDQAQAPANGAFLAVNIDVTWVNEWDATYGNFTITPDDFDIYTNADLVDDAAGTADTCLLPQDRLPLLAPGVDGVGTVVLDGAADTTSVVYAPAILGGTQGWEWSVAPDHEGA